MRLRNSKETNVGRGELTELRFAAALIVVFSCCEMAPSSSESDSAITASLILLQEVLLSLVLLE